MTVSDMAERFGLGSIDQVSFVVSDVEEAATRYQQLFGPFQIVDVPAMDVVYRGEPSTVTLKLAFARSGQVEIELVQVVDGQSPARDRLMAGGEGFHHVRFPVPDLDATRDAMEREGFVTVFAGRSGTVTFAYLEPPDLGGTLVELVEGLPTAPS